MDQKQVISENFDLLLRCLDPSIYLLGKLRNVDFFEDRLCRIEQLQTVGEKNDALLRSLLEIPAELQETVMTKFIATLRSCGQSHVANIFRKESDEVPMSTEHWDLLRTNMRELCMYLDPGNGLLVTLYSNGIISSFDRDHVRSAAGYEEKASTLVEIIMRKDADAFQGLVDALNDTGQAHVAYILTKQGDNCPVCAANNVRQVSDKIPMSTEHWNLLRTNMRQLCKFLDPENGLLVNLYSAEIISSFHSERVRYAVGYNERARTLVEIIMRKSDDAFQGLVKALNDTGQAHVVYILTKQGDERPLCEEFRKKLTEHRTYLVKRIDSKHSGLITALVSKGVFSKHDQQRVTGRQPDTDINRSEVIMDLMARKSQSSFDRFIAALEETGQRHVAVEFIGEEVVARIIARTRSGACLPDAEAAIRQHIQDAVEHNGPEVQELNDVLRVNELAIVEVGEGSIIMKFRCKNQISLKHLKTLHISVRLDELLTKAFCPRFRQEGLDSLDVDIQDAEFERCERTFLEMKLMTSEHRDALESSADLLADKMKVDGDLLDKLSLCQRRRQAIEQSATREQQVKTLLDIVSRQPDSAFTQLLDALTDTQQHEARETITSFCSENTTSSTDVTAGTTQMTVEPLEMKEVSNVASPGAVSEIHLADMGHADVRPTSSEYFIRDDKETPGEPCPIAAKTDVKSTTLTHVIPSQGRGRVTAVTSLGNDVFVARWNSEQVEVYDAKTLTLQRRRTVPGLGQWPFGLAACPNNDCLYASDYSQDRVHRVELSGNNAVKKWSVAKGPRGLSVNSEHNLIVACYGANKLQEYTTHGSLVREIRPQAGETGLWHAIQLSTGDYVVSQCTSPDVVSVVGVDGRVVRRYGQSQTSDLGQMKNPRSLAVTKNDDILVADEGNNRILSINSSLGSIQELVLSVDGGIKQPWGLCLDESRGRLYVGEWRGECRVLCFDLHL